MVFNKPMFLSYIVAALHLVWSFRVTYTTTKTFIFNETTDGASDGIYDMPIPAVRYLLILFVLVLMSSMVLIIGLVMKQPLCIASFLLTMTTFMFTFAIFAIWDVLSSYLKGTRGDLISLEFMDDSTLIIVEFVILYPIFLVLNEVSGFSLPTTENNSQILDMQKLADKDDV